MVETEDRKVATRPLPLKFYGGSLVLAVLAAVALGFGGWLASDPEVRSGGIGLLVVGVLLAIGPVVNLARRPHQRATMHADARGLTVARGGRAPRALRLR